MVSVILRGTEVQKIMWVFHLFDENDDGTIELEETEQILDGCDQKLQDGEVEKLFNEMDVNHDGKFISQYLSIIAKKFSNHF